MKTFTLFWLTGQSEIVNGTDIASAMNNAGYSAGALGALDFYANGDEREKWVWNMSERTWNKKSN
jgi:hypothetical protein